MGAKKGSPSGLGLLVRAVRSVKGWTQKDLAARPGAPGRPEISRLESGENRGTSVALRRSLCEALGVSYGELAHAVERIEDAAKVGVVTHDYARDVALLLLLTSEEARDRKKRDLALGQRHLLPRDVVRTPLVPLVKQRFREGMPATSLDIALMYEPDRWDNTTVMMALTTEDPDRLSPKQWVYTLDRIQSEIGPRLREIVDSETPQSEQGHVVDLLGALEAELADRDTPQPQPAKRPKRSRGG